MREIKFRALNRRYKKSYLVDLSNSHVYLKNQQIDKETLTEFTSLKDKNGQEIYEGDVLTPITKVPFVVLWSGGEDSRTVGFFVHKLITNETTR